MIIKIFMLFSLWGSISSQNYNRRYGDPHSVVPGIMSIKPQNFPVTNKPVIESRNLDEDNENPTTNIRRFNGRGPLDDPTTRMPTAFDSRSFGSTSDKEGKDKDITNKETNNASSRGEGKESAQSSSSTVIHVINSSPDVLNTELMPSNNTTDVHAKMTTLNPTENESRREEIPTTFGKAEHTPETTISIQETTESVFDKDLSELTTFPLHYHGFGEIDEEENLGHHAHLPQPHGGHREERESSDDHSDPTNEDVEEDLCASCLCDQDRKNVYCKHEHESSGSTHHMKLRSSMIPKTATYLHLYGFENLTIYRNTFSDKDLELRNIKFQNIRHVKLAKESLLFDAKASSNREVAVSFVNCTIPEMPMQMLTQNARSVDQSSDIDLENTRFLTLQIIECNITTIRSYALSNARLLFFTMSNSKVEEMEEHSFHVDIYDEWIMEGNQLPMLMPHSICLRAQQVVVFSKNTFRGLNNRSIEIISSTQVLFEFNHVLHLGSEALLGIVPEGRGSNLVFMNNTVVNLEERSLLISRNYPTHERKILNNKFFAICDCNIIDMFLPLMGINNLSNHNDNQTFNKLVESSSCKRYALSDTYSNINKYIEDECTPVPLPIIISVAVVVVVIIITIIVCVVCNKRAEKAKEEANYLGECCYSHSFSTLNSGNQTITSPPPAFSECGSWDRPKHMQPWVIAVPEVKTYQETEVQVRYEQTDPLNASVRGSVHEPVIDFQRKSQIRASCPFN